MPLLRSFVVYLGYKDKELKKVNPDHLVTTFDGVRDIYDLLAREHGDIWMRSRQRQLESTPPIPK